MRLALIQNSCTLDRAENLRRALASMERAKAAGAELVAFPELAIERFFPQHEAANARRIAETIPGPTADAIADRAKKLSLVTVFNMYEAEGEGRGRYFDSSPVFDADGSLLGVTRMVHITDYTCFHEQAYYDPGDRGAPVYDTAVGKAIAWGKRNDSPLPVSRSSWILPAGLLRAARSWKTIWWW